MRRKNMQSLVGHKTNKTTIIGIVEDTGLKSRILVKCDCGNIYESSLDWVRYKKTQGCMKCRVSSGENNPNYRHGLARHPLERVLNAMKDRCYRESDAFYYAYGARGITVCEEWRNSVKSFYDWAMVNGYKPGLQIDRENNDGNYCPENCRFVTCKVNARNTSANNVIEYKGERLCLSEWSERLGIHRFTLFGRIFRYGWSVERAMTTPAGANNAKNRFNASK